VPDGGSIPVASSPPPAIDAGPVQVPAQNPPSMTDAFLGAPAFVPGTGLQSHHPGESCMQSGCHGSAVNVDPFFISGTVYADYAGKVPVPGIEIRVRDMAGRAASVYSGANGNFFMGGGGVSFPAVVGARNATTTRPMVTVLTRTMGSCASAGCHIVGGSPATGAYYPIHVP
jgi:hypothetical protein